MTLGQLKQFISNLEDDWDDRMGDIDLTPIQIECYSLRSGCKKTYQFDGFVEGKAVFDFTSNSIVVIEE